MVLGVTKFFVDLHADAIMLPPRSIAEAAIKTHIQMFETVLI